MTTTDTTALTGFALDQAAQDLLFREARTANAFTDEPVTDDELRAIYDLVKFGPTGGNAQPLRITFVRTPEGKERLLPLMYEGNQAKTASAPVVAILAADIEFHENLPRVFPIRPEAREMWHGPEKRDMRRDGARLNAILQAAYFIIGIRAAGLAAGPMGGFDAAGVAEEFYPGGNHDVFLVVNIGHPAENAWFDRLPRLEAEEVVTWA